MSRQRTGEPIRLCIVNPLGYELFDAKSRASKVFGGAEVQLYYLATALAAHGFEVSMIVERPVTGIEPSVRGVRMIGVPPSRPRFAWLRDQIPVPSAIYLGAMRDADADIYLQRGGAVLTGDVGLYCATNRRRFVFMAAHDWDCDRHHLRGRYHLAGRYYAFGLHRADQVVAQSRQQQEALLTHHRVTSLVQRTVYPAPDAAAYRREHVLWVGRCLGWKRPMAFLELAQRRPDHRFVMACPVYEGARALYGQVVRRAAQLPNVRFLDFVPFAETEDLFQRAAVFVNTSTIEGFPNTFVQAARCGTPIASLNVNPDDILRTNGIGDCAYDQVPRLVRIVNDMLDQTCDWQRQSDNCRRYFHEEHDLASVVPGFAAALRSLVI